MSHQSRAPISAKKAEALLTDWANMPGPWPFVEMDKESLAKFVYATRHMERRYGEFIGDPVGHLWLRDMLQRAWTSRDPREREWLLFRFREAYAQMSRRRDMTAKERLQEDLSVDVTGARYAPPPLTAVEAAAFHLQKNLNRALYCPNDECPAPYFFSMKKGQKFCSPECARPARLESQRRYWNEKQAKIKRRKR